MSPNGQDIMRKYNPAELFPLLHDGELYPNAKAKGDTVFICYCCLFV